MPDSDSSYDDLASDYHWLFSEDHVAGRSSLDRYGAVLAKLSPDAEILDCACGGGFEAVALARAGYRVTGSDASEGMVGEARRHLKQAGLDVPVVQCRWDELPSRFAPHFDAVFCLGNSIAHADGASARLASLVGMRAVLVEGGVLVVESRDWEKMRAEHRRFEVRERANVRHGVQGICLYVWTIPNGWEEPHVAEVVLLLQQDGRLSHRVVELTFSAYSRAELLDQVGQAGFGDIEVVDNFPGRYVVTARAR